MADEAPSTAVGIARGVGLAVWSWIALAATLALVNGERYARLIVGQRAPEAMVAAVGAPDFFEVLGRVLVLDFGESLVIVRGVPVWKVLGQRLGATVLLTVEAVALAGLVAAAFVALSGADLRDVAHALGYLGAVPAFGWAFLWFYLGTEGVAPMPAFGRGDLGGVLPGAVVLALVAGAALGRAAARDADRRAWLLDGWLSAAWLVGGLVVVEQVFAIPGVARLWLRAVVNGDAPLFFGATAVLALPLILASALREAAWTGAGRVGEPEMASAGEESIQSDGGITREVETDVDATADSLAVALRSDRQVQAGLLGFGALLVGGLVVSATTSPPTVPLPRQELLLARVADSLGAMALTALVGTAVAVGVGLPLGTAARESRAAGHAVRLTDYATNVPVLVFVGVWLFVLGFPDDPLVWEVLVGALAGFAVAPLVLRAVEDRDHVAGVGVALTGGAFVAFVAAELALFGLAPRLVGAPFGNPSYVARTTAGTFLAVALPALPLLVAGEGLRRH